MRRQHDGHGPGAGQFLRGHRFPSVVFGPAGIPRARLVISSSVRTVVSRSSRSIVASIGYGDLRGRGEDPVAQAPARRGEPDRAAPGPGHAGPGQASLGQASLGQVAGSRTAEPVAAQAGPGAERQRLESEFLLAMRRERLDHAAARPGVGRTHRHQRHRPELPEHRGADRSHDRGRPGQADRADHRLDHRGARPARGGRLRPAGTRPEGPAPGDRQPERRPRAEGGRGHLRTAGQGVARRPRPATRGGTRLLLGFQRRLEEIVRGQLDRLRGEAAESRRG